jgi:hypothetical protein
MKCKPKLWLKLTLNVLNLVQSRYSFLIRDLYFPQRCKHKAQSKIWKRTIETDGRDLDRSGRKFETII